MNFIYRKTRFAIILFLNTFAIIILIFQPALADDPVPAIEIVRIDPVQDHFVNESFLITGMTNIPAGNELIVEIQQVNHTRTIRGLTSSGVAGRIVITNRTGVNTTWAFPVDTLDFIPDRYRVEVSAYPSGVSDYQIFSVSVKPCDPVCSPADLPANPVRPLKETQPAPSAVLIPVISISLAIVGIALYQRIIRGKPPSPDNRIKTIFANR